MRVETESFSPPRCAVKVDKNGLNNCNVHLADKTVLLLRFSTLHIIMSAVTRNNATNVFFVPCIA